ncbi:cysteine-rich receptor-like protein kinase 44 isoform X1 [Elaeis guineensis]|uniref:Receptor-like protein kinase At4g00960 isoform X1 n=2 Tax=Elaeis guineensis var. tenera TaxID=51953 RepID=A0A6I9RNV5_ELAGV|nr:putative receptor-like protein kinase At4g00960 isoform X1 [Elaeis guineensis]
MRFRSWLCVRWTRRTKVDGGGRDQQQQQQQQQPPSSSSSSSYSWNLLMDLKTLEAATDNFSDNNLLGRGGFGPVYKGVMGNGQEIAVKKLSLESRQGMREFTNEVRLLLKVQHRNLVSLLGCCASAGQKMLVYPYFPNGSLDHLLFDKSKRALLDWSKRFEIIVGVAKGLLYLHEESPVKIIHRDIKASNILLDDQLNPKISDFGMARLFQEDATHVNTFKISGTYGYMAPEYALNGYLSAKADVFSFGVLVLEIVSGRKNLDKHLEEEKVDLLSYTWKLSEEGKALEVMDHSLSTWNSDEAALCIQIGLLCCQAIISDRPDMYTIQLMLSSDSFTLPKPGRPGIRGRTGRWTSTSSSTLTNTNTNSTLTGTDSTKASTLCSIPEDYSRNSISVSFTSEGR